VTVAARPSTASSAKRAASPPTISVARSRPSAAKTWTTDDGRYGAARARTSRTAALALTDRRRQLVVAGQLNRVDALALDRAQGQVEPDRELALDVALQAAVEAAEHDPRRQGRHHQHRQERRDRQRERQLGAQAGAGDPADRPRQPTPERSRQRAQPAHREIRRIPA
jgi:hypothetical protein